MGIHRNNLDIFFYYTAPGILLNNLLDVEMLKESRISHTEMDEEFYYRLAAPVFPLHTEDEQKIFYQCAKKSMLGDNRDYGKASVFNMLYNYADDILLTDNRIPLCRYEKILNWRDMSLRLGQDLFTCSFLAHRDVQNRTNTEIFSWPAIISTDNEQLHRILQKGLAENHFHLLGSSRTFELSWLSLMNNENMIYEVSEQFNRALNHDVLERTAYREELSWRIRLKQASIIRTHLFNILMSETNVGKNILNDLINPLFCETDVQSLRLSYGYKLPNTDVILDYALTRFLHEENYIYNRALVGERYLLYQCFKRFYNDKFSPLCCNLFYLYLLIKSQFRGEMIQRNRRVGFKNFSDYQKRKDSAIENITYYRKEQVRLAIKEVISENNMKSFETRIIPQNSVKKMRDIINDINRAYSENTDLCFKNIFKQRKPKTFPYFFVLHFPKEADKEIPTSSTFIVKCRNHVIRQKNKLRAKALAGALNKYPELRKLIRGIDGCSNEIGCRPEVMAHEFRFLSNFIPDAPILLFGKPYPLIIKRTYHVGEDFMDLADGLRAIDEAILFLNLKRGDRLGHALALGIDCMDYYNIKNKLIIMKKQDLLDNICWLLRRSPSLGIIVPPKLKERLNRQYHEIANDVYNGYPAHNIEIYYDAWRLRGDAPYLYRSGNYKEYDNLISGYEHWGSNAGDTHLFRYSESAYLYYAYHFDPSVRNKGEDPIDFDITDEFIQLIEQIQRAMQRFIEECGIGIETNPTSNYLISSIKRFDNHPLLRFYNLGLEAETSKLHQSAQLFVSINTDDQGVFDTNLENEYAVMANAVARMKLPDGNKRYMSAQVYHWLDQIRQMGIEQSFSDSTDLNTLHI